MNKIYRKIGFKKICFTCIYYNENDGGICIKHNIEVHKCGTCKDWKRCSSELKDHIEEYHCLQKKKEIGYKRLRLI